MQGTKKKKKTQKCLIYLTTGKVLMIMENNFSEAVGENARMQGSSKMNGTTGRDRGSKCEDIFNLFF